MSARGFSFEFEGSAEEWAESIRRARTAYDPTGQANARFYEMMRGPAPLVDVERERALDRARKLQRLLRRSTFAGERENAATALVSIVAKHGLTLEELEIGS